ncbi:MAG TPA: hypothetical protein VF677_15260, partial [Flavobacterium sp.]
WDKLGIKDWAKRNISWRQIGNGLKDFFSPISNGIRSIGRGFRRLFGERKRDERPAYVPLPPTPAISNHQLSSGWQNEGFGSSEAFSGSNQSEFAMQQIDPPGGKRPDADGKITLEEANKWYREGNGQALTVDASKVDLNFLDTSKMVEGKIYPIQTLTTSKDGRVYGGIRVKYLGNNQVGIRPDTYNFEQHGSFFSSTFRNIANAIGRAYAGNGVPYKINFIGVNTIRYTPPPTQSYMHNNRVGGTF